GQARGTGQAPPRLYVSPRRRYGECVMALRRFLAFVPMALALALANTPASAQTFSIAGSKGARITAQVIASFEQPWAMTFLPDGALLVTTRPGRLYLLAPNAERTEIRMPWRVAYGGQGGMGDVVLHPGFA